MAKSRYQIHLDYQKAKSQADKLEDAARMIRHESSRMESCRADVRHAWEGDNAAKFTGKMSIVSGDLGKIASQLERTAAVIRKNAKRIYDAEMEAKRLAEIRSHS